MTNETSSTIFIWLLGIAGTAIGILLNEFINYLKRNEYYKQRVFEKELETFLEANRVLLSFQNMILSSPNIKTELDLPKYAEEKAVLLKTIADLRLFLSEDYAEMINRAFLYLLGNEKEGFKESFLQLLEIVRNTLKMYLYKKSKRMKNPSLRNAIE